MKASFMSISFSESASFQIHGTAFLEHTYIAYDVFTQSTPSLQCSWRAIGPLPSSPVKTFGMKQLFFVVILVAAFRLLVGILVYKFSYGQERQFGLASVVGQYHP